MFNILRKGKKLLEGNQVISFKSEHTVVENGETKITRVSKTGNAAKEEIKKLSEELKKFFED